MVGLRQLGGYDSLASRPLESPEPPPMRDSEGRTLGLQFSGWSSPALMNLGLGLSSTMPEAHAQENAPGPTSPCR